MIKKLFFLLFLSSPCLAQVDGFIKSGMVEIDTTGFYEKFKGKDGDDGQAATITVGNTTTLPAGSSATVTNSGTANNAVLNFGIPKGADGINGTGTITNLTKLSINSILIGENSKKRQESGKGTKAVIA